ncbi:MAG: pyridoxine 5'-phosphate synthase [Deltaproteobacteria bacterium]|nr:pyridoxine 5'-phosphate synthase [Deltaproteobacteria bacterium]
MTARLGVNIDHVATIRELRHTAYPDILEAAIEAKRGGADQITIHLREDRRHIQDADLDRLKAWSGLPLNLEMAATDEMVRIAVEARPERCTIVPERREELTTEGGLDVVKQYRELEPLIKRLGRAGIDVSLFIDPETSHIAAAHALGITFIELHTGQYSDAPSQEMAAELNKLQQATKRGLHLGMQVAAGHGLHLGNVPEIVLAIPEIVEYNIGHSIVSRAVIVGLRAAVAEVKDILEVK